MKKRTYRLAPDRSSIGQCEHYYADRAAEGLLLYRTGALLDRFTPGEPERRLYRTEVVPGSEGIPEDLKILYAACGWDYVDEKGLYAYFSAPENAAPPEPHSSPELQARTLRRLRRNYWSGLILPLFYLALLILPTSWFRWAEPPGLRSWVEAPSLFLFLLAVLVLELLWAVCHGIRVGRLIRQMKQGVPLDHQASWRPAYTRRKWAVGLSALGLALGIGLLSWELWPVREPMPTEGAGQPALLLTELHPGSVRAEAKDRVHYHQDQWEHRRSLLAPEILQTYEQVTGEGPGEEFVWLWQNYYRLCSPDLARRFALAMSRDNIWGTKLQMESLSIPGLDLALAAPNGLYLICQKGERLLELDYLGPLSLEEVAQAVAVCWQ